MSNETLQFILSALALIGVIFAIYKYFREPDIKSDKDIAIMENNCENKHKNLDEKIAGINSDISFIKENHLRHIEADISFLKESQVKIFTILDERLPKK